MKQKRQRLETQLDQRQINGAKREGGGCKLRGDGFCDGKWRNGETDYRTDTYNVMEEKEECLGEGRRGESCPQSIMPLQFIQNANDFFAQMKNGTL